MKIEDFLESFSFYIFLIVVVTFFLLLVQGLYLGVEKIKEYRSNKRYKENQEEIFEIEHCIKLLSQYKLILRPHTSGVITRTGSQRYYYVLQPETVKMIKQRKLQE